jgi:hypothetical protein
VDDNNLVRKGERDDHELDATIILPDPDEPFVKGLGCSTRVGLVDVITYLACAMPMRWRLVDWYQRGGMSDQ